MWKTTFCGKRLSVESNLRWRTTFIGGQPSLEDDLWGKTTFGGRQSSVEDNLRWKMTFNGRRPSVEVDLQWKTMIFLGSMLPQYLALCTCFYVCYVTLRQKSFQNTSKQGRGLRFGMLTVFTNIKSTMASWQVEDDLQWKTTFGGRHPLVERQLLSKV